MGSERRRDPRIRCNIPCDFRIAGRTLRGKLRDVSASGLSVTAEAPGADQGDAVTVTLRVDGLEIEVRALVWHVRTPSRAAGDKGERVFGLVVSDSAPEFARMVARLCAKRAQPTSAPCPPPPAPLRSGESRPSAPGAIARARDSLELASPEPPRVREYRIRIQQKGAPRTCQIVASGVTQEAAVEAALSEVGQGWIVLEVVVVR
ncbi:MAG: PilZ domain-containing protein [Deltaproteobacteria bacterium]|nr:PilZ domain-containing protein [Deltaproteobacteria bacterium]